MSKWYLSFVLPLNLKSASQIEVMNKCITQNNLFYYMAMLQYWVYWLILILSQSHHTWCGYIFNIAKLYSFFLLSYFNSVFSELDDEHLSMEIQYYLSLCILVISILFDAIASPMLGEKQKPNSTNNYAYYGHP